METSAHKSIPHYSPDGAVFFVTSSTFKQLILPEEARRIALDCIKHNARNHCKLFAAVVMPDHFHLLIQPMKDENGEWLKLSKIMNVIKGFSSHEIKEMLDHRDPVWLRGYFERVVRGRTDMGEY